MKKIAYNGYRIWISKCDKYTVFDIEWDGYDYPVASFTSMKEAEKWINEHPNGDNVVKEIEAQKAERARIALIDILCG